MAQHTLRRSLAAFTFATLATLAPLSDLSAEQPGRRGRSESRGLESSEPRGFSVWGFVELFLAKYGVRIDGNGFRNQLRADPDADGNKYGVRIDGNGFRQQLHTAPEAEGEKYGVRIDGNG